MFSSPAHEPFLNAQSSQSRAIGGDSGMVARAEAEKYY